MNKVLVTGLGVANSLGMCEVCGLDFSWLANNPSVLLWSDKLIIPSDSYDAELENRDSKSGKVIGMFLEMADEAGLIEKVNLSNVYDERMGDDIFSYTLQKKEELLSTFPQMIKNGDDRVPEEIVIEDYHYCGMRMASVFAGLRVAEDMNANCLFSNAEHVFLKYLYGLDYPVIGGSSINKAYSEVFSLYLPEAIKVHSYAFENEEKCKVCKRYDACKERYLEETESSFGRIFKWRDYDELQQAKTEIENIIKIKDEVSSEKDIQDVVKQFKERQDRINKMTKRRFPEIERWTKMTTVVATPLTVLASIGGNTPLTIAGAVALGAARMTEGIMDAYKNKNNWVGFVNNMKSNKLE